MVSNQRSTISIFGRSQKANAHQSSKPPNTAAAVPNKLLTMPADREQECKEDECLGRRLCSSHGGSLVLYRAVLLLSTVPHID